MLDVTGYVRCRCANRDRFTQILDTSCTVYARSFQNYYHISNSYLYFIFRWPCISLQF